jgi:hypothetical protein
MNKNSNYEKRIKVLLGLFMRKMVVLSVAALEEAG